MTILRKDIAGMLFLAALTDITCIGVRPAELLADQVPALAAQPPAPPSPVSDHPTVSGATLSNGVSFEIIGIGESPSTDKQWWLANGDLLKTPPYASMHVQAQPSEGCVMREIAVRINDVVDGSVDHATVTYEVSNIRYACSPDKIEDHHGKEIPGMIASAFTITDLPGGVTVHANIAAGKWRTLYSADARGAEGQTDYAGDGVNMTMTSQFLCSRVFVVNHQSHIIIACDSLFNRLTAAQDFRLIAVDRSGNFHPATPVGTVGSTGNFAYVAEFSVKLPLDSIRQWQFQSRPFDQWIEIRGLSLHPGQKTNAVVATSDNQKAP